MGRTLSDYSASHCRKRFSKQKGSEIFSSDEEEKTMAGIDTQKQLLSLIRDFTSERSRGGKIILLLSLAFVFGLEISLR